MRAGKSRVTKNLVTQMNKKNRHKNIANDVTHAIQLKLHEKRESTFEVIMTSYRPNL